MTKSFFPFRTSLNTMSRSFSKKMRGRRTSKFFGENRGLTSLEKSTFSYYVKMTFLQSKKPFFPIQNIIQHHVQVFFKENETRKKFQIFEENHGLTPLEKCTFSHCVKMTFLQSRKPCFCILNIIKHHVQVFFDNYT